MLTDPQQATLGPEGLMSEIAMYDSVAHCRWDAPSRISKEIAQANSASLPLPRRWSFEHRMPENRVARLPNLASDFLLDSTR
jgi:hypothetical protein